MREEKKLKSYKGFLYIKCPHCGKIKAFRTREGITHYRCKECKHTIVLEGTLKGLYIHCQCSSRFKHMTNMTEKMFDVECLHCGNPVTVEYNRKKKVYQTVEVQ